MTEPSIDEDRELVRLARGGDFGAFEKLVSKYERRIYTLALRITHRVEDAEDVSQDTFLSVVEHLKDFREEAPFRAWLLRIATNHALQRLRKRRGLPTVHLEDASAETLGGLPLPEYIARWQEGPEKLLERPETAALIDQALSELDEKYRAVFLLRDVEQLSTRAAAEALGITETNLKVRLLRARLMLRERLTRVLGAESTRMERPRDHSHVTGAQHADPSPGGIPR